MTASISSDTTETGDLSFVPRTPPKRDWRRAWDAIKILIADSERTDQVFVLLDALGGPTDEAGFQSFATDPRGQRQLTLRPDLLAELSDHEALRALPEAVPRLQAAISSFRRQSPFPTYWRLSNYEHPNIAIVLV